jgi:trimethylguanosine synthase
LLEDGPRYHGGVLEKFRQQKYFIFSRFDEGIAIDDEGWYSVTPEPIAKFSAYFLRKLGEQTVVIDGCCGVGGNLI